MTLPPFIWSMLFNNFDKTVKGGAYNWLEYLMNKLKGDYFIGHDTSFLL